MIPPQKTGCHRQFQWQTRTHDALVHCASQFVILPIFSCHSLLSTWSMIYVDDHCVSQRVTLLITDSPSFLAKLVNHCCLFSLCIPLGCIHHSKRGEIPAANQDTWCARSLCISLCYITHLRPLFASVSSIDDLCWWSLRVSLHYITHHCRLFVSVNVVQHWRLFSLCVPLVYVPREWQPFSSVNLLSIGADRRCLSLLVTIPVRGSLSILSNWSNIGMEGHIGVYSKSYYKEMFDFIDLGYQSVSQLQ